MRGLSNTYWLGTKELLSLFRDVVMVVLLVYSFTLGVYLRATGATSDVNNASVAIVDEDRSTLSGRLSNALYEPYFKTPEFIDATEIQPMMDTGRYMFVITIPPRFEADVKAGRTPELQLNVDATAVRQASLGAAYIRSIAREEVARFVHRSNTAGTADAVPLVLRRAFNPNGTEFWFTAISAVLDQLTLLTIILTGAALLREREHGTIEHLLAMPLTSLQIGVAKIWANCLVVMVAFLFSMAVVVQFLLDVPIAGSRALLYLGTAVYLFSSASIGIFLGVIARTMAQFALLFLMTIVPIMVLSGGMAPVESQPDWLQPLTALLPSRHYMSFATAIIHRGAGIDVVWPNFLAMAGLGLIFFVGSMVLFRRSISVAK